MLSYFWASFDRLLGGNFHVDLATLPQLPGFWETNGQVTAAVTQSLQPGWPGYHNR